MGMSWKPMSVLTESRTAHLSSRASCRGSWLLGTMVKDLSWAVKQLPQNAVVHSEPGLSRNQILILEEVTILVSVAYMFVFLKALHHGACSSLANS